MGIITIEKSNHLFWLGRYVERVFTSILVFQKYYDDMIDQSPNAYTDYCERLNIPCIYKDTSDFNERYIFSRNDPNSIVSNLIRAYDNAIVLREELSGDTLAYIDMSLHILDAIEDEAPILKLQSVLDYLYAFWGSVDDNVESEACRNIIKCGKYAERIDLYFRFDYDNNLIVKQLAKLRNRTVKLKRNYNLEGLDHIEILYSDFYTSKRDYSVLISDLSKLFEVECQ